jgi:hypothetical protein
MVGVLSEPTAAWRCSAQSEQFYTDAGKGMRQSNLREGVIGILRESPMEQFVSQQNIERYRRLLDISTDDSQRRVIVTLLAQEQEKMSKLPQSWHHHGA